MRTSRIAARRIASGATLLGVLALLVPAGAGAANRSGLPRATTGNVTNIRGTSAVLQGSVNPNGHDTTYVFQYGPTVLYGTTTTAVAVGSGAKALPVAQSVNGILLGYHYRITATSSAGTVFGKDKVFASRSSTAKAKIVLPKGQQIDVFGSPFLLNGHLTGLGNGGRKLVLQSSPYPYLEPFSTVSAPATTNSLGAFSFRVLNLLTNTQLRVATLDLKPLYSPVVTEQVAVRVTVHVRRSGASGLVRIYGTVYPAIASARVRIQLAKSVRPGRNEIGTRYVTKFSDKVRHATSRFSRFSTVVKPTRTGNYRVEVEPKALSLSPGTSAHFKLTAAPGAKKKG